METLKDIFVSKEIAKKLKAIGFSEPCISYYLDSETYKRLYITNVETDESFTALGDTLVIDNHNKENDLISAPTYEQVFKWFRSKLMCCKIESYHNSSWGYQIETINKGYSKNDFKTYEEAREQLILKLIEIYKDGCKR